MELSITFSGGKRVEAHYQGLTIATDQPVSAGGQGTAPEPFALFAASIGTCAGFYAVSFCQARGLDPAGLVLRERLVFGEGKKLDSVELDFELPRDFPAKYVDALLRAANGCAVKKAIAAQPAIVVRAVPSETRAAG